jgi:site-specific recombinase XerD
VEGVHNWGFIANVCSDKIIVKGGNMLAYVDDFLAAKRQEGRATATIKQYRWHLARLEEWLVEAGINDVGGITRRHLREWGASLLNDWAPSTVKTSVTAARSWLKWCYAEGYIAEDLSKALATPRVPRRTQRTLTGKEINRMLAGCDDSPRGRRDAAIISLLADSGLRRSELIALRLHHVDLNNHRLSGFTRKGGDDGWAAFGDATARRIVTWLALRPPGNDALFVAIGGSYPGRALTGDGLRTILRKRGEAVGVPNVTPHAFRRAFACLLVEGNVPTRIVQALGGWSDVRQVERYTAALDAQRLASRYSVMDRLGDEETQTGTNEENSPHQPHLRILRNTAKRP